MHGASNATLLQLRRRRRQRDREIPAFRAGEKWRWSRQQEEEEEEEEESAAPQARAGRQLQLDKIPSSIQHSVTGGTGVTASQGSQPHKKVRT
jgi:hypothetical protein